MGGGGEKRGAPCLTLSSPRRLGALLPLTRGTRLFAELSRACGFAVPVVGGRINGYCSNISQLVPRRLSLPRFHTRPPLRSVSVSKEHHLRPHVPAVAVTS